MRNKVVIEVGACDGTDSFRYYNSNYKVFSFEPRKDFFENLKEKTKSLIDFTIINKAVSLTDGLIDFNICKKGGASSILQFKTDDELIKYWGPNRTDIHYSGISYKVESIRLDTFIEQNNLQDTFIDFLHVDAQGADLDVLKSLGKYKKNVLRGVIESAYSSEKTIYINQNNTLDVVFDWLKQNDFVIEKIESNDFTNCECNIYFKKLN